LPANLTPVYHAAEERFRQAKTKEDKLAALDEMLAVMPKHKGTDHLQADIKRRMAKLRSEEEKGGVKTADPFLVPKEGAGQAALLGFPNTGKSALVGALTRAKVTVAEYPFTTPLPVAGMMKFEDIRIQLVDLPPVTAGEMPKGMSGTLRLADIILLVVDGGSDDCLEQFEATLELLREKRILLEMDEISIPHSKTAADILVLLTKADQPGYAERKAMLAELLPAGWQTLTVSVQDPESLEEFRRTLFQMLNVVRVYSKIPGKEAELASPFVLKAGETILDFAGYVHRDFPEKLKHARVWGSAKFPGQSVERDFQPADKDIVELHV
jgi:ribosome-interacting GTPase 1